MIQSAQKLANLFSNAKPKLSRLRTEEKRDTKTHLSVLCVQHVHFFDSFLLLPFASLRALKHMSHESMHIVRSAENLKNHRGGSKDTITLLK